MEEDEEEPDVEGGQTMGSAFPDVSTYPPGTYTKADLYDREVLGDLLSKNDVVAVRKMAKRGSRFAQGVLGVMASEGKMIPRDMVDGRKWLGRAAEAGDFDALFLYADMLLEGRGGPVDVEQARVYLKKAVQRGHIEAASALSDLLLEIGGEQATAEARQVLRDLANKDSVSGMLQYSRLLFEGIGGPVDEAQGTFWLRKAEKHPDFQSVIAQQEGGEEPLSAL